MQLEPGQTQPTPSQGLQIWSVFIQQLTQTCWWELILEEYLTPLSAPPCSHPLPQWVRGVGCWCSEQALGYHPTLFCQCACSGLFSWQTSNFDLSSRRPFSQCNSLSLCFNMLYFNYVTYKECKLLTYNLFVCSACALSLSLSSISELPRAGQSSVVVWK